MAGNGILESASTEAPVEEEVTEKIDETSDEMTDKDPSGDKPVDAPERPEYLDEQFWDPEKGEAKVEAMAKSYRELRKAFNDRNNDKPGETIDEYAKDFIKEEGYKVSDTYTIPADDPAMKIAFEAAKESGLGIKAAQSFISKFVARMEEFAPVTPQFSIEAEMEKLGPDAHKIASGLKTWVDGMKAQGELSDEGYNEILALGKSAAGIKALSVLREKTGEIGIPTGVAVSGNLQMTADDWYNASYETHAQSGESRAEYDKRMHEIGKKIFGTGVGTFDGSGLGIKY